MQLGNYQVQTSHLERNCSYNLPVKGMSCSHANSFITRNASFSSSESPTKSVTSITPSLVFALKAAIGSYLWKTM